MTWLSILVPVYNVEPFLEECIESVMNQVGQGVEVLVLDDCSTDDSWPLMQKLAQRWPGRIQLLQHSSNAGLSAARNTMLEAAQGQYLWFLDSDDKLQPGSVKALANIVRTHAPDVVLCDFSVWREKPRLKHRIRGELHRCTFLGPAQQLQHDRAALITGLLTTGQMHAWSKISKRALWGSSLRFPRGRYFEDLMTMPLLALRCQSYYYCARPWVAYRQRATSILSTMNLCKAQDQSASLIEFSQSLRSTSLSQNPALKLALAQQCARNFIGAMRFLARSENHLTDTNIAKSSEQFKADFGQASPYSVFELQHRFFLRGWWLRALKLRTWTNWKK